MANTSLNNSTGNQQYFVFYDLDHTLTAAVSGTEMVKSAYRKGLMRNRDLLLAAIRLLGYKLEIKDPLELIEDVAKWLKGVSVGKMNEIFTEVFRDKLKPAFYPEARNEIEYHKSNRARSILLSSSLKPVCQMVADHFMLDDIICSDLEVNNGFFTGRSVGAYCFREEKAVRLKDYCEKNNSSTELAWYYGDSIDDLPALKVVGNPVCVNPDRKLLKIARQKAWKVCEWGRKGKC
jgi:HAD superfamily hydrolase (TIGR01490 family)